MKNAFVFPGQGSQSVGMLNDISNLYPLIKDVFAEGSDALGFDLWAMSQEGSAEVIGLTENTQPLLLTASIAVWRLVRSQSEISPDYLAGHSLGEYSALVAADVLSFSDAVVLVRLRGQLMQQAVSEGAGAMAAILGLEDAEVMKACAEITDGVVEAVNFNAPGQVVIAGEKASVEAAIEMCKKAGARKAMPLPVSVPSHCSLMRNAAEQLGEKLAGIKFSAPLIPVIQNTCAAEVSDADQIRHNLVKQLYSPVLWRQTIESLVAAGVGRVIECGPGKVLSGLSKRIDRSLELGSTESLSSLEKTVASLVD